jgi:predicted RNase H-like HicB family nuclease
MAKTKTYTVTYERDEKGLWLAHVKGLAGCHTQGRTIAQARERIREAISLFDEHVNKAHLEDDVRLPSDVSRLVSAQWSARSEQEVAEAKLRTLNVRAARALTKQVGLSLRDAGELLGASQESVGSGSKRPNGGERAVRDTVSLAQRHGPRGRRDCWLSVNHL